MANGKSRYIDERTIIRSYCTVVAKMNDSHTLVITIFLNDAVKAMESF